MRLITFRAVGLIAVLVASRGRGLAIEILPARPNACDDVRVAVTRAFTSDCNWTAEATQTEGGKGVIEVLLELRPETDVCLPVEVVETFEVSLGKFAAGDYRVTVSWIDLEDPPEEAGFSVSEGNCGTFRRGDANQDGIVDISDAIAVLTHLFLGGTALCLDANDADGSGSEEITDGIYLLNHLFAGGDPPPAPYPGCGSARAGAPSLGCENPICSGPPIEGQEIWLGMADGCVQCEICDVPSLESVVAEIEASGIPVAKSGFGFVPVCLACTVCQSGRFYLVLVTEAFRQALELRGWRPWEGEAP